MKDDNVRLRFYFPRMKWDGKPEMYNIFDNIYVDEAIKKEVRKYLKHPSAYSHYSRSFKEDIYGFPALSEEFLQIFRWQYSFRCEYETILSPWPPVKDDKSFKIDIAMMIEPNIEFITYEILRQYKEQIKSV